MKTKKNLKTMKRRPTATPMNDKINTKPINTIKSLFIKKPLPV